MFTDTLFIIITTVHCAGLVECLCVCLLFIWKFHQVELFLIATIGVCVYGCVTRYVTSQRKQLRKESNTYDNLYSEMASDSFANIEQVKCCNGEQFEIHRYSHAVALYNQSRKFILSATGILKISQQCIISFTLFASLYITVKQVLRGDMDIGDFIAVHAYTIGMFNPLNALGGNYNKVVQALVDVRQLADLMEEVPTVQDVDCARRIPILNSSNSCKGGGDDGANSLVSHPPPSPGKPIFNASEKTLYNDMEMSQIGNKINRKEDIFYEKEVSICFENVGFHYSTYEEPPSVLPFDGEESLEGSPSCSVLRAGLCDVSFTVPSGTTTAIVGSSGSGKTTLSRMLFRFYDPSQGRVLFNDYDIKDYTQESIRSCISLVPQDTILFNNSILYNVKYGRLAGVSMEEVEAACEAAQILEFIETLPNKWDTVVGERGMRLSGVYWLRTYYCCHVLHSFM